MKEKMCGALTNALRLLLTQEILTELDQVGCFTIVLLQDTFRYTVTHAFHLPLWIAALANTANLSMVK